MADWSKPAITDAYATAILQVIDDRLDDAVSLFNTDGTNIPANSLKYDRVNNKFQERLAGAWSDKLLSIAGGGTGAATAANARTNLGLGTIATQASSNVSITGGAISGTTLAGDGSGITALNASQLTTGTVGTARLGTGVANASNFLRGDQTWAAPAGTLPAGLIALFDVACPSGWTRFIALDGRFPRGASTYGGTGGADTHSHGPGTYIGPSHVHTGPSHTHTGPSHTHGIGTLAAPSHTHSVGAGVTDPPSATLEVQSGSGSNVASLGHTHGFDPPSTGAPTATALTGAMAAAGTGDTGASGTGNTGAAGNAAITGNSDSVSNVPSYLDVIWCKKD